MGSNPYEIDNGVQTRPLAGNSLQQEADAVRFGHPNAGGFANSFEEVLSKVPEPLAATAGLAGGFLARMPGEVGLAGKVLSAGLGLTYGGDLAVRLSGTSSGRDEGAAVLKDSIVLGSIGLGMLVQPRLSGQLTRDTSLAAAGARPFTGDALLQGKAAFSELETPAWAEGTAYPAVRNEFLNEIKSFSPAEQSTMKDALNVAEDAHAGQLRDIHIDNPGPRDPFVIHPVRSALILMQEAGVRDPDMITSAVLHDVVEDSGGRYTIADIGSRFGPRVQSIVGYVTKPAAGDEITPEQLASYYKGLESAPSSVRDVKLADRLDNIRDTVALPDRSFQERYLNETVDKYIPLAQSTRQFWVDELTASTQRVAEILRKGT